MPNNIELYLRTAFPDEMLMKLLNHCEQGKLSYHSCCCLVGFPTSNHPPRTGGDPITGHLVVARTLEHAREAEAEFRLLGATDDERREKLLPVILAEMSRRGAMTSASDVVQHQEVLNVR